MGKKYDVVAIGEYLVDFSPNGNGPMGNPGYEMNPGGAPSNCLASCAKFGGKTAIIAAVGDDLFGDFLKEKVAASGIDTYGIQTVEENTTLVFVSVDSSGERRFAFVRSPGADTCIDKASIPTQLLSDTKYLHFGTLSLTDEPARSSTEFAIKQAKKNGVLISFDPNYRAALWESEKRAKDCMLWGLKQAELVKMSEEELSFLFGEGDVEKNAEAVLALGVKELYITSGEAGAYCFTTDGKVFVPGFAVSAVDTTGCGDAFTGAILYQNCCTATTSIEEKLRFANAVGALCATKPGGMTAMPDMAAVNALLERGLI